MSEKKDQKLNLPKTSIPMKANLNLREPEMLKQWEKRNVYKKIRKNRKGKEKFILHDGPPYACLLYTSPSPRDGLLSRMPSSA